MKFFFTGSPLALKQRSQSRIIPMRSALRPSWFCSTMKTAAPTVELVHEGKYAAEVPVELIEEQGGWPPYFSFEDAQKLEAVRLALRRGDIAEAAKYGRVFELTPVAAK
jgi:hypothetical protein